MKKRIVLVSLFAALLVLSLSLIACNETTTYTVTFDSDGGSQVQAQTVEQGKTATEPTGVTKEGYTLDGWYNGEAKWNFTSPVNSDVTLKAKWKKNVYTVVFDSDGGTSVAAKAVNHGEKVAEPTGVTKEGFNLDGWYNGETKWNFDTVVTSNMTLKAKWSAKTVTVTFNSDGGTKVDPKPVAYGSKVEEPTGVTKEGYTLDGWYNGNVKWNFDNPVTGDMTLTAKWTLMQFKVTFDSNGGQDVDEQTVDYGKKAQEPTGITRFARTLVGWYIVDEDGEVGDEYDFDAPVKSDVTLQAQWQRDNTTLNIPKALVGTWKGTELFPDDEDTCDFTVVINADGTGSVDFSMVIDFLGTPWPFEGSYVDVLFNVEDDNLMMYFRATIKKAEQCVVFEIDDDTLTTDAGPNSYTYGDTELTLTKEGLKLKDLVGTWKGTETIDGLGDFEYTIVINTNGTGAIDCTWMGDPEEFDDVSFEIEDGKLVMYFTYDEEDLSVVFEFDGENLTTDEGPMAVYWEEEGELILTKQAPSDDDDDDFDPSTVTFADMAGTWMGSGTAYGSMTIEYTIVIDDTGIVSLEYTMGYGMSPLIDMHYDYANAVFTIYFKDYESAPEKHFTMEFDGTNLIMEKDGVFGVKVVLSKVITIADLAGSWYGSAEVMGGSYTLEYWIVIDETGIVSIEYSMGWGNTSLIDMHYEYEDGVFTVYFKDYDTNPEKHFDMTFDGTNITISPDPMFGATITLSREAE